MSIRQSFLGFSLAVGTASTAFAFLQDPAAQPPAAQPGGEGQPATPKKPAVLFRQFREHYLEGKFDVAAESLKDFLAAGPSDAELIEIDNKYGATFLLGLRNLPQWSDNPTANAAAKKTLEELIAKTQAATKKITQDPKRLSTLIRNLAATPEERLYSEIELKRAGAVAVPAMIEILRSTSDVTQRAGILGAVPVLGVEIVPPLLAALDGLSDDLRAGVVNALAARQDVLSLLNRADTDPTPHLWYFASLPDGHAPSLRESAKKMLENLYSTIDRRRPSEELVRLAKPLTEKRAAFLSTDTAAGKVKVWTWDQAANNVKAADLSPRQAEEYFGLRDLKWAVERSPSDESIQSMFLAFAAERAVERSNFADLASSNPAIFSLLAAAPTELVNGLLDRAIREQKAALAFAAVQTLGTRGAKSSAEPTSRSTGEARPALLVRALDFPDDRVQFAAAVALLRSPAGTPHGANAKVIDVLKRAAAVDSSTGTSAKAILADPGAVRSARVGEMFRQAGYAVESVSNTRDVLKRISRSSDIDLIVLDRHVANPMIRDFLTQLRSIPSAKTLPVLVVASADQAKAPTAENLLLRLALLIAATETENIKVPAAFAIDRRRPDKDNDTIKAESMAFREKTIETLFNARLARLQRLVKASNFPDSTILNERMRIRLPQLTYAVLAAEYPVTKDSTPEAFRQYEQYTKLISTQPELDKSVASLPTRDLIRIVEQLEAVLTPELQKKFDQIARVVDPASLLMASDSPREAWLEDQLNRDLRQFVSVRVVPEPFSPTAVEQEINSIDAPAAKSGANKISNAKLAIEWLKKCAVGEVVGYDVRPAEGVLRTALRNDDYADNAIDAVARIGTAESQQDLLTLAISGSRPAALRVKAADAAVRHIQSFGKLANATQLQAVSTGAVSEADPAVKSKLIVLSALISAKPGDLAKAIQGFSPASIDPPAPKPAAPVTPPAGGETPPAGDPKN